MHDVQPSAFSFVALGPKPFENADEPMSAEKEDAIRRLIEVTQTLTHARQMSQAAARFVGSGMKHASPEQAQQAHRVLAQEADQVFAAHLATIAAALFPVYHRHFSLEEIEAMVAFNSTPLGQKILCVMPQVMKEVAVVTEEWARGLVPVFYKRALARMRADGVPA